MIEPVKVATSLSAKLWKNEHSDATEMNKYALPIPWTFIHVWMPLVLIIGVIQTTLKKHESLVAHTVFL